MLYRPERTGGVLLAGAGIAGSNESIGRVRNLALGNGPLGSNTVSFDWESPTGDTTGIGFVFFLVVNGDVVSTVRPGVVITTVPNGEGTQDIDVIPIPASQQNPYGLRVDLLGNRAVLTWTSLTDSNLKSYEVFWDNGTGTVDTATRKAIVNQIDAPLAYGEIAPTITVGSGNGKIRVTGEYSGDLRNGQMQLVLSSAVAASDEILPTGQLSWTLNYAGSAIATGRVYEGSEITALDGLRIAFVDSVSDYTAVDQFFFFLGIRSYWVSENLDPDTYKFQVRGVDTEGDTGTLSAEASVTVVGRPDSIPITAEWNATTRVVSIDWSDDSSGNDLYIYASYDFAVDELTDYVLEEGPVLIVDVGEETAELDALDSSAVGGTLRLYARTVDSDGVEDDNASLVTLLLSAVDVAIDITAPIIEGATVIGGPKIRAQVAIDAETVIPSAIRLLTNTADDSSTATTHTVSLPSFTTDTGNVLRGNVDTGVLADGSYYLWVQGQNASGDWTNAGAAFGPIAVADESPDQVTGLGVTTL